MTTTATLPVDTRPRRTTRWWVLRVVGTAALSVVLYFWAVITLLGLAIGCDDACSPGQAEAEAGAHEAAAWIAAVGMATALVAFATWWSVATWARRVAAGSLAAAVVLLVVWWQVSPAMA